MYEWFNFQAPSIIFKKDDAKTKMRIRCIIKASKYDDGKDREDQKYEKMHINNGC